MPFLTSIRTSGDDVEIVNQLLLPHVTEWVKIDSVEDAHGAIKSMKENHIPPYRMHYILISLHKKTDSRRTCHCLSRFAFGGTKSIAFAEGRYL